MTISKELMLAILSMDTYNRGYGASINGLGGAGSKIGNATIRDDDLPSGAQDAGFYAVSYQWGDETIISYRGTDQNLSLNLLPWVDEPGSDLWNGYGIFGGSAAGEQAGLAAEFYQSVTKTSDSDPRTGSAILTGHSLGGGLAERLAA